MRSLIHINEYKHVDNIVFSDNNISFSSAYNINYYFSKHLNDLIMEICNDDNFYSYYRINKNTGEKLFIGNYEDYGNYFGIFNINADIVELHDDIW